MNLNLWQLKISYQISNIKYKIFEDEFDENKMVSWIIVKIAASNFSLKKIKLSQIQGHLYV